MRDPQDEIIDKALAALRNAPPPEGMNARIAARLLQPARQAHVAFSWHDLVAGSTIAGAWTRGMLSGAAVAAVVMSCTLLAQHRGVASRPPANATNRAPISISHQSSLAPVTQTISSPCAKPALLRAHITYPVAGPTIRIASSAIPQRPRPAIELPLTQQERDLVRLARIADPKQLAIMSPENHAGLQAEDADSFDKFFTPPPRPAIVQEPFPTPETKPTDPDIAPQATPTPDPAPAEPTNDKKGKQ